MAALESPAPRLNPCFTHRGDHQAGIMAVTQSLDGFPTIQDQPRKTPTWRWSSLELLHPT